jgi:endonuclease YncB( thermonuclease family)
VLPQRAVAHDVGPLKRAERTSLRHRLSLSSPDQRAGLWFNAVRARLGEQIVVASLAAALALSRAKAWRQAHPLLGAPNADAAREAVRVAVMIRSSRVRRWRRARLPWLRAAHLAASVRRLRDVSAAVVPGPRPAASPPDRNSGIAGRPDRRPVTAKPAHRPRLAAPVGAPRTRAITSQTVGRNIVLFGTIGAVALLVVLAVPRIYGLVQPEPASRPAASARALSPASTAPAAEPIREARLAVPAKLQDEAVSPPGAASRLEPYRIAWPYDIADGLTFGPEGALKTRLAGLEGPGRDAVCNDRHGQPWACGLQARAALHNATRRQSLLCDPVAAPIGGTVPARCRGELDLARELVLAGFARPTSPDPALDAAAEEARRAERGLWNGGWTIRMSVR